jgi:hypothetical protein
LIEKTGSLHSAPCIFEHIMVKDNVIGSARTRVDGKEIKGKKF